MKMPVGKSHTNEAFAAPVAFTRRQARSGAASWIVEAINQSARAGIVAAVLSERLGLNVDNPFAGRGPPTRVAAGGTLYPPAAS